MKIEKRYKEAGLFALRLFAWYGVFYLFFQGLIAALAPDGHLYWGWLHQNFDIVKGFRRFLMILSQYLVSLLGYQSSTSEYLLTIEGKSVRLVYSCLGFGLTSALWALILAYPGRVISKIVACVLGFVMILTLNVLRIGGLAVLHATDRWSLFYHIDHHDFFNLVVVLFALMFFSIYLRLSRQSKAIDQSNIHVR